VLHDPDKGAIELVHQRAFVPFDRKPGNLSDIRERLYNIMWNDVGILRTGETLARAKAALQSLEHEISACGISDSSRRYNLTWMDRLNLENLTLVSQSICAAAAERCDSRGAHFREDFPKTSSLDDSRYTRVSLKNSELSVSSEPVNFARIKPGESLLQQAS